MLCDMIQRHFTFITHQTKWCIVKTNLLTNQYTVICNAKIEINKYFLGHFRLAAEDQRNALSLEPDSESAQQCLEQCNRDLSNEQTVT